MAFCSFSEGAAMFDVTPIENMFLLEYLPTAPDGFLRVYLYARMLCLHPELGGEIGDVAKALRMDEDAVFNAFSYWERQGLVERMTDRPPTYAILQLKGSMAAPAAPMEREYYEYREFNASLQELCGAEHLLHPQQYKLANDWLNVLGFTQDAVLKLVAWEIKRSHVREPGRLFKKVDKTAIEWADRGIRTAEDVERAIAYDERVYSVANQVMKQFAMRRQPTVNELDCVRRWLNEWQLEEKDILAACAETTKSRAPSIAYLDAILKARQETGADEHFEAVKAVLRELGTVSAVPTPDQIKKYGALLGQGFEPETIRLAAVQCSRKKKNSFEELEWMVSKWGEVGVRTHAEAEKYVSEMQQATQEVRGLLEIAGLTRRPSMDDLEKYESWKRKYTRELVFYAAECARGTNMPMRYIAKLLETWDAAGVKSVEAARARQAERPAAQAAQAQAPAPARNYQQHSYTEADFGDDFYYDPLKDYGKDGEGK